MPAVLVWGLGAALIGTGVKFFGDGVEDSTNSASRLLITGAIAYGGYKYLQKQKVIK